MIVVLSGEGPTDLGSCTNAQGVCSDEDFAPGPMCVLLERLIEPRLQYAVRSVPGVVHYVSERALGEKARERKANGRRFLAPGAKHVQETGYFYANAWDLGAMALEIEQAANDDTIAVLFRDNDPMRSDPATLWSMKWQSMKQGFERAGYPRGIPMLPNPKSEAWLVCAAKEQPFQHCAVLEELSGNDAAPDSAKSRLARELGGVKSAHELNDWLETLDFNAGGACDMPSFSAFHGRLHEVMDTLIGRGA
jgi:hypothetical protein